MSAEFNIPFTLHSDSLVMLMSQTFQLTLTEVRSYFSKSGRNVEYCGYSSNHMWRPVSLVEGVPLEGGTLRFGTRHLTLPERLIFIKTKSDVISGDRIRTTVVEMHEVREVQ